MSRHTRGVVNKVRPSEVDNAHRWSLRTALESYRIATATRSLTLSMPIVFGILNVSFLRHAVGVYIYIYIYIYI